MTLIKNFPLYRSKEAYRRHWKTATRMLFAVPWAFSILILLVIGQKMYMFCNTSYFKEKSAKDQIISLSLAFICWIVLMVLPFINNNTFSSKLYKATNTYISGALLIASIIQLEAIFGRKQCFSTIYLLIIFCRSLYNRSVHDNFSLCVAFSADFGAIGNNNLSWYIRANLFIWTYFILLGLFQGMLGRYLIRIWQHIRYLIIMKEKTKRQKAEQQSILAAHLDEDILDHIFTTQKTQTQQQTPSLCPCHNSEAFLKKPITTNTNTNTSQIPKQANNEHIIQQVIDHDIITSFDPGNITLQDLHKLHGFDRRNCVMIAIRIDKSHANDCALVLDMENNFHQILNLIGNKFHITCIRKCGNIWIGTLGFFQTSHADFEHCYTAVLFGSEIEYLAHKAGFNIAIAIDHGSMVGGFLTLQQPQFDLYGQELRWLLRMIDLKDYTSIIVSDMMKSQMNIYKRQYPEAIGITTAKKSIEFPWKKDFVVTVQTITNSYELRNFITIDKHMQELGFGNIQGLLDYLLLEPWSRIIQTIPSSSSSFAACVQLQDNHIVNNKNDTNITNATNGNNNGTAESIYDMPDEQHIWEINAKYNPFQNYYRIFRNAWYDGYAHALTIPIWERLQFSLEDTCLEEYNEERLVKLHEEIEYQICNFVLQEYYNYYHINHWLIIYKNKITQWWWGLCNKRNNTTNKQQSLPSKKLNTINTNSNENNSYKYPFIMGCIHLFSYNPHHPFLQTSSTYTYQMIQSLSIFYYVDHYHNNNNHKTDDEPAVPPVPVSVPVVPSLQSMQRIDRDAYYAEIRYFSPLQILRSFRWMDLFIYEYGINSYVFTILTYIRNTIHWLKSFRWVSHSIYRIVPILTSREDDYLSHHSSNHSSNASSHASSHGSSHGGSSKNSATSNTTSAANSNSNSNIPLTNNQTAKSRERLALLQHSSSVTGNNEFLLFRSQSNNNIMAGIEGGGGVGSSIGGGIGGGIGTMFRDDRSIISVGSIEGNNNNITTTNTTNMINLHKRESLSNMKLLTPNPNPNHKYQKPPLKRTSSTTNIHHTNHTNNHNNNNSNHNKSILISKQYSYDRIPTWDEYLYNANAFVLNVGYNFVIETYLLAVSLFSVSYLINMFDHSPMVGMFFCAIVLYAIGRHTIHAEYSTFGNYMLIWCLNISMYATLPCELIIHYAGHYIKGQNNEYGDFGMSTIIHLFSVFRFPVFIGQNPLITLLGYIFAALVTGWHYQFRTECSMSMEGYIDVIAVAICILLWCTFYQYFVFVSYIIELKIIPKCQYEYQLTEQYTYELFHCFTPQLAPSSTTNTPPLMHQNTANHQAFSLTFLENLHLQQYYHSMGMISLHIKPADTMSSLLDPKEFHSMMKTLDSMIQSCLIEYNMLLINQFSGVYFAITNPFSNTFTTNTNKHNNNNTNTNNKHHHKQSIILTRKQIGNELVILIKTIQDKLEKFNIYHKVNIIIGMSIHYGSGYVGFLGNAKQYHALNMIGYDHDMTIAMASYHIPEGLYVSYHYELELSKLVSTSSTTSSTSSTTTTPSTTSDMIQRQLILPEYDNNSSTSSYISNYWLKVTGKLSGIQLDDFGYIGMLGRGGYGSVHLVCEKRSNIQYAIKVIVLRPGMAQMIKRECIILQKMQHTNLVNLKYSFITNNRLYLVMSYIPGGTLKQVIERNDIEFIQLRIWFAELLLALDYVHRMGIIHRDVKPANCMISTDGHLKLADFGLAKSIPTALQPVQNNHNNNNKRTVTSSSKTGIPPPHPPLNSPSSSLVSRKSSSRYSSSEPITQLPHDISNKLQKFLPLKASNNKSKDKDDHHDTNTTTNNTNATTVHTSRHLPKKPRHWQVTALFIQSIPSPVTSVVNSNNEKSNSSNNSNGSNGSGGEQVNTITTPPTNPNEVESHVLTFSNFSLQYYIVKNRQEAEVFLQQHNIDSIFIDVILSSSSTTSSSQQQQQLQQQQQQASANTAAVAMTSTNHNTNNNNNWSNVSSLTNNSLNNNHQVTNKAPPITTGGTNATNTTTLTNTNRTHEMLYWLNMMEMLTSTIYGAIPIYIFNIPKEEEHLGQYFMESGAKKCYTLPLAHLHEDLLRKIYSIAASEEEEYYYYDEHEEEGTGGGNHHHHSHHHTPSVTRRGSNSSMSGGNNSSGGGGENSGGRSNSNHSGEGSGGHSSRSHSRSSGNNTRNSGGNNSRNHHSDTASHPHQIVGTMYFIAPEILRYHYYDIGVDWWAYGITIYYCLEKHYLFSGDDKKQVFQNILNQSIDVSCLSFHHIALESLVKGLLTREYEHRLGCHPIHGIAQLKQHPFYREIDWKTISHTTSVHYKPFIQSYKKYDMKDKLLFYGELEAQVGKKLLTTNIQAMEIRNHYALTKYKQTRKRLKEVKKGYIRKISSTVAVQTAAANAAAVAYRAAGATTGANSSAAGNNSGGFRDSFTGSAGASAANTNASQNAIVSGNTNGINANSNANTPGGGSLPPPLTNNWFVYDPVMEEENEDEEDEEEEEGNHNNNDKEGQQQQSLSISNTNNPNSLSNNSNSGDNSNSNSDNSNSNSHSNSHSSKKMISSKEATSPPLSPSAAAGGGGRNFKPSSWHAAAAVDLGKITKNNKEDYLEEDNDLEAEKEKSNQEEDEESESEGSGSASMTMVEEVEDV